MKRLLLAAIAAALIAPVAFADHHEKDGDSTKSIEAKADEAKPAEPKADPDAPKHRSNPTDRTSNTPVALVLMRRISSLRMGVSPPSTGGLRRIIHCQNMR